MLGIGWWDGFSPWIAGWLDGFRVVGADPLAGGLVGALVGLGYVAYRRYRRHKDTIYAHRVYWDDK